MTFMCFVMSLLNVCQRYFAGQSHSTQLCFAQGDKQRMKIAAPTPLLHVKSAALGGKLQSKWARVEGKLSVNS
ncbi:MAG: hypothetical protein RQ760_01380 [Sedimentisphaerales bacterium]|nr:hypothetical protein [Sedimentisphaerales bacterium]